MLSRFGRADPLRFQGLSLLGVRPKGTSAAGLFAVATVLAVACASPGTQSPFASPANGSGGSGISLAGGGFLDAGVSLASDAAFATTTASEIDGATVVIAPSSATVTVTINDGVVTAPSVQFSATVGGAPVDAAWSVDEGAIGTVTPSGVFTPTGQSGGTVNVIAGIAGATVSAPVTVIIERTQNGFTGTVVLGGSGGYGGVGGEGPGGPISAADMTTLQQKPTSDPTRSFQYPYDGTVWPRGLLAPLLQWTPGAADATAIALQLTSKTYVYAGYFGRPAALAATSLFLRHPIPQDVWQQATESTAGGDTLQVSLVLLQGGKAVGPLTESWRVAPGILQGTVYYESYGTLLVTNSDFTAQNGTHVGAAVLGIQPGALAPSVVAGTNTPAGAPAGTGCRACHSVAANGSSLIVQDNVWPYDVTSQVALQTLAETPMTPTYVLDWAALSPDGTYALTSSVSMGTNTDTQTQLYQLSPPAATALTVSGLPAGITAATPAFSPDGQHVAFTHVSGTLQGLTGNGTHVVAMSFDPTGPSMTGASNVFTLPGSADGGSSQCVGFPSFLPTNDALLVQLQLAACQSSSYQPYVGTGNVQGEIWWTDLATATQHRLDALNGYNPDGTSYLPVTSNHTNDAALNYEPTVNPAPSGGYAWVIFTSRRLYGSIATIDPFSSDPRYYNNATEITTKKLWVAAVDLNAEPGTDPSHPAFYLPAQELQAGNARGFWVLNPCLADGASCSAGDQCCGGYCEALGDGGSLVCGSATPTCAADGDRCATSSNCCSPTAQCIDGFCAEPSPTPPPR